MNMKTNQNINVGIDTGKYQLDIYIRPLDIYFTVENNEKGINEAVKNIKKHNPNRMLLKQREG
jgi:transposase